MNSSSERAGAAYEVCFRSLLHEGRELCFQCDEKGQVCIDELSDCARHNYLFVRTLIGRDFARPQVRRNALPTLQ